MPPNSNEPNLRGRGRPRATVVAALAAALSWAVVVPAAAQEKCRGTKQWYAGQCRYPDEIAALKRAAAEAARRKEEAARRKAADEKACKQARADDTVAGWKAYLDAQPEGRCIDEAEARIEALERQSVEPAPPQPPPTPEPPDPTESPSDSEQQRPGDDRDPAGDVATDEGGGLPTLVYVGFGAAGLGVLVGGITGAISFAQAKDLQNQCPNDVCPTELKGEGDTMLALAHVSTAGFILAGVGATVGVVALLTAPSEDGSAEARLTLGPGWAGITGTF